MRSRGVAIPTALFMVLVLFALVTATVVQVRQDLVFTSYGHVKTQAIFLSRAALNLGYQQVAANASFVEDHLGKERAFREGQEIAIWFVRHPEFPDVYYLFGQGTAGRLSFESVATLKKKEEATGVVYARRALAGTDVYYYRTPGATDWSVLPAAPRSFYKPGTKGAFTVETKPGSAPSLSAPVGDLNGGLYAVWRRDGIDSIFRFDKATNKWNLVPPAPQRHHKRDGTLVESPGKLAANFQDLATDGKDILYARTGRDGVDTIHRYDTAANQWTALPAAPAKVYQKVPGKPGQFKLVDLKRAAGNLVDLGSDGDGNLVARLPRDGIDTVYRYDAEARRWDVLPEIPKVVYRKDPATGEIASTPVTDQAAGNLSQISVDKDGTVYGRFNRDGVDTIYRFDGTGRPGPDGRIEGAWAVLDPPSKTIFDNLARKTGPLDTEGVDPEEETAGKDEDGKASGVLANPSRTAVDAEGRLYLRYTLSGRPDSLVVVEDGKYEILPPIPKYRYVNGQLALAGGFEPVVNDLAGGSLGGKGGVSYAPVSSF